MTTTKLTKDAWIDAGLKALVSKGPQALKAEALARKLGATKGSFYWHFKDVPAFQASLLSHWQTVALTKDVAAAAAPATTLRKLVQTPPTQVESAIRAWAQSDTRAAKCLAEFDHKRLTQIADLLDQCGVSNPELARAVYAAMIGMQDLSNRDFTDNGNAIGTLVDLILALR